MGFGAQLPFITFNTTVKLHWSFITQIPLAVLSRAAPLCSADAHITSMHSKTASPYIFSSCFQNAHKPMHTCSTLLLHMLAPRSPCILVSFTLHFSIIFHEVKMHAERTFNLLVFASKCYCSYFYTKEIGR